MVLSCSLHPLGSENYDPYEPSTLLVYQTGQYTYKTTLPKGVYQVCVTGGGGSGTWWVAGSYGWGCAGGSGACVEVVFFNPRKQALTIYAGGSVGGGSKPGQASYMDLGGVRMITCNGGGGGPAGSGGAGGVFSINSQLQVLQTIVSSNGRGGSTGFSGSVSAPSVSPYNNWGRGGEGSGEAGGLRLQYLRLKI